MLATLFIVLFGLVMGLALTFYGMRVFLVLLPVWGFFAGFWLGAQLAAMLLGEAFLASNTGLLSGLVLGVVFGFIAYFRFELGVALVVATFAMNLANGILQGLGYEDTGVVMGLILLAVAVLVVWALIRFKFDRYLIIVITALAGASVLVATGLLFFGGLSTAELVAAGNTLGPILRASWLWSLAWLVLAALGVIGQLRMHRNFDFTMHDLVDGWG